MKKLIILLKAILLSSCLFAQTPEKMSYQAVIRDTNNNLIIDHIVSLQISILQGSITGNAVYVETHAPTTNDNGLVSIEIGGGTLVGGNFETIDWTSGPYFIKSETDPTGGTNYTITGTSQLLSVPYALYAKSAGTIIDTSGHYVGELYGGGIIFWVSPNKLHGLVMSVDDISRMIAWSNITNTAVGNANDFYDGLTNSNAIVAQTGHTISAAKLCLDYSYNGFDDWYLPASWQISQIFHNVYTLNYVLANDGNPATVPIVTNQVWSTAPYPTYWSSTEDNNETVWYFDLQNGCIYNYDKSSTFRVRAIRAF